MDYIKTENHGQLITGSSYWGSPMHDLGKLWISVNAGAIRVLVPASMRRIIEDMRKSRYVICSRGPWTEHGKPDAVELLFEDLSDEPFAIHVGPESCDALPADPSPGQWVVTVWDLKKGRPHKALERVCHWRRSEKIPDLRPLK